MDNNEQFKKSLKDTFEKIDGSAVFLSICSQNFIKDPYCLMQFGLAILLDKPLFLLIEKGVRPSKHLLRILEGYEFYEQGDIESAKQASMRLILKSKKWIMTKT